MGSARDEIATCLESTPRNHERAQHVHLRSEIELPHGSGGRLCIGKVVHRRLELTRCQPIVRNVEVRLGRSAGASEAQKVLLPHLVNRRGLELST